MKTFQQSFVSRVFEIIPAGKLLSIAQNVQKRLSVDAGLKKEKLGGEIVTFADTQIQATLLDYFSKSSLKGTYVVKAEEDVVSQISRTGKTWQLIIDPLDGTTSFAKGEQTWGVMVGACNIEGILQYSWNLVSTGDTFTSVQQDCETLANFRGKISAGGILKIDVYDYDNSAFKRFGRAFELIFSINKGRYKQTSYPSAVWAGWQLNLKNIDGLLWLPSDKGKRWYPDYDLVFLGALAQKGYKIRLGKIEGKNSVIVVAPSDEDADALYKTALQMMTVDQKRNIVLAYNPLQITKPL